MKKDRAEAREFLLHCPPVEGCIPLYAAILGRVATEGADLVEEWPRELRLALIECLVDDAMLSRLREVARASGLDDTSRRDERRAVEVWWTLWGHKLPKRKQLAAARDHLTKRGIKPAGDKIAADDRTLRRWLKSAEERLTPGVMYSIIGKIE